MLTDWWARLHARPARRHKRATCVLRLEPLEERTLLSTVHWIAGSGNFHDGSNWSGGVVPGPNDVAVIDTGSTAATITIQPRDNIQVQAIYTASADTLSTASEFQRGNPNIPGAGIFVGGALTVTAGSSTLNGPLAMDLAGSLTAKGSGVSLTANGPTTLNGASLFASGGAQLSLPTATSYTLTSSTQDPLRLDIHLQASGSGSTLRLGALTSVFGIQTSMFSVQVHEISALSGGQVQLPALPTANVSLRADGAGSTIDVSALTTYIGGTLRLTNGATVLAGALTTWKSSDVTISGGTYTFTNLANIDGSDFHVSGGAHVSLPAVTSIAGGGIGVSAGAQVSLPAVTSIVGSELDADGIGSTIDLSAVTTYKGGPLPGRGLRVTNGGTVNLSALATFTGGDYYASSFWVTSGGTVLDSALTNLNHVSLQLDDTSTVTIGITIGGTSPGSFGHLFGGNTYPVSLNGARLQLAHTAPTPTGSTFAILTSPATISGTFQGLPQDAVVTASDGTPFMINYQLHGGGATTVTLTQLDPTTQSFITSFSPTTALVGTAVTITGTKFTGATAVAFGGVAATAFSVNSDTQITATVPADATTGPIIITTPNGTAVGTTSFTVVAPPTISGGFSPAIGPVGTQVFIYGANFFNVSAVTFNGVPSTFVVNVPQIIATVPSGATTGPITVTTPYGTASSLTSFTVGTHVPTRITSASPGSGPIGSQVVITGTNFSGVSAVYFRGVPSNFVVNSPTQVTATVPGGAATSPIVFTTPTGNVFSDFIFTVTGSPTITGFSPGSGPVGSQVVIAGTNFSGVSAVAFNGMASNFVVNSPTQITATVPSGATAGPITVTMPGVSVSAASFTVTTPAAGIVVTGADAGGGPQVRVYDTATNTLVNAFFAYDPNFTGGVRVALGNVNGDAVPDIVTAPGAGGGPDIHVYDGATGQLIRQFFAYVPNFTGGVYVAAGDVNGDGFADIICGADAGGGPNVTVFSGKDGSRLLSFFPYDPAFTGGVRVAAGDTNSDGKAEVITGAGSGGGPNVTVYEFNNGQPQMLQSYFAYDPRFSAGVYVAAGDVDGDGRADVVVGAGAGGGPNVAVFNGVDGALLASFFAFDPLFTGGVRVAAVDRIGTGRASVIAVPGPGGGPQVRTLDGLSGALLDAFFAYDPAFTGGLFVAAGR